MTEVIPARTDRDAPLPPAPHYVPLDLVLALPTGSMIRDLVQQRRNRGERPKPMAKVFAHGRQYFAVIDFEGPGRRGLLIPLDVFVWEPWR